MRELGLSFTFKKTHPMSRLTEENEDTVIKRFAMKWVRDSSHTPYDLLPNGETLGEFANRHALEKYNRKIGLKRERAKKIREHRLRLPENENEKSKELSNENIKT